MMRCIESTAGARRFGLLAMLLAMTFGCQNRPETETSEAGTRSPAQPPISAPKPADDADSRAMQAKLQEVIAVSRFGPLTRQDLLDYARDFKVTPLSRIHPNERLARSEMAALSGDQLTTAARWLVARLESYEHLKNDQPAEEKQKYDDGFNRGLRRRIIMNRMIGEEVDAKLPTPSETEIKAYYEQHQPEFNRPFQFQMHHLIRMTYVEYKTQPGDTLESIAERISGAKEKADEIRANVGTRPLRREKDKEFKPLAPDEELLVPMDEQAAQKVKAELERILGELKQGTSFAELCRRYSNSERAGELIGPLPSGTKPLQPELLKYAQETAAGQVSPIFRTAHGWQVIQIVQKQDEGFASLEEARATILEQIVLDARNKLVTDLTQRMFENPNLKVEYDLIAKQGDDLSTPTIIATLGRQSLAWDRFQFLWERYGKPKKEDAIRELLKRVVELQEMLLIDMAGERLAQPESPLSKALERARIVAEGEAYIAFRAAVAAREKMTDERLAQFYEEHKDASFRAQPQVTFVSFERRMSPEGRQAENMREEMIKLYNQVKEDLANVRTPEEFKAKAAEVNALLKETPPAPPESPTPISREELPKPLPAVIDTLKPGQWSDPFLMDNHRVVSLLLLTKEVRGYRSFADAEGDVRQMAMQEIYAHAQKELGEQYLTEAKFESKL